MTDKIKDNKIVSLDLFRKKTKTVDEETYIKSLFDKQDDLVDEMEEIFPEGCILIAVEKEGFLGLVSTIENQSLILEYLELAIEMVRNNKDK